MSHFLNQWIKHFQLATLENESDKSLIINMEPVILFPSLIELFFKFYRDKII